MAKKSCECEWSGDKIVTLCGAHEEHIKRMGLDGMKACIHISQEAYEKIKKLVTEEYQDAAQLGMRLYREAIQKRIKE